MSFVQLKGKEVRIFTEDSARNGTLGDPSLVNDIYSNIKCWYETFFIPVCHIVAVEPDVSRSNYYFKGYRR